MTRSNGPFAHSLIPAALAVCCLSGMAPALHAEHAIQAYPATQPGRHVALWDPPHAFIRDGHARGKQVGLDEPECPSFVFRNSFELGYLDGIFRTGFELPPDSAGARIRYTTAAGYIVQVSRHTITIQDPLGLNSVQHWGDPHENLNGKHIKDWAGMAGWDGTRRSVLMDDGTKVTMESAGPTGVVALTSIYDGQQNLQIDNTANIILHHGTDMADSVAREAAQYDGETARFTVDPTTGIALYNNVYNEDSNFVKVDFNVALGSTGGCVSPTLVNDYFP